MHVIHMQVLSKVLHLQQLMLLHSYLIETSFLVLGASALATSLSLKQLAHDPMCFVLSRLETLCQV